MVLYGICKFLPYKFLNFVERLITFKNNLQTVEHTVMLVYDFVYHIHRMNLNICSIHSNLLKLVSSEVINTEIKRFFIFLNYPLVTLK